MSRTSIAHLSALSILAALGPDGFRRRGVYFNTPEAEGAAPAVDTSPAPAAAPASAAASGAADAGAAAGGFTDDHAYQLHEINARVEADPDLLLNDQELELYTAGNEGRLQAKARPEGAPKGADKPEDKAADDAANPNITPEVKAAMDRVGAKTPAELEEKIKGLQQLATGKDAQAFSQLKARFDEADAFRRGEAQLYEKARAGDPDAIKFLREQRGVVLVSASGAAEAAGKGMPAAAAPEPETPPFKPEDDAMVDGALSRMWEAGKADRARLAALETKFQEATARVEAEGKTRAQAAAQQKAQDDTISEMLDVAQFNDELKALPELKNRLIDFLVHGKDDPQLAPWFGHLFEVANKEGCSLKAAYLMEKGRNADALIAKAREEGVRTAVGKPENKSLSHLQTQSDGDKQAGTEAVTETQLQAFEAGDLNALPASWFDKEGNFVKSKIPPKLYERLGIIE